MVLSVWVLVYQTAEEGSNLFGQDNSNYPILETYAEGSVMEVKVVVSTNHWVSLSPNGKGGGGDGGSLNHVQHNSKTTRRLIHSW